MGADAFPAALDNDQLIQHTRVWVYGYCSGIQSSDFLFKGFSTA